MHLQNIDESAKADGKRVFYQEENNCINVGKNALTFFPSYLLTGKCVSVKKSRNIISGKLQPVAFLEEKSIYIVRGHECVCDMSYYETRYL